MLLPAYIKPERMVGYPPDDVLMMSHECNPDTYLETLKFSFLTRSTICVLLIVLGMIMLNEQRPKASNTRRNLAVHAAGFRAD